MAEKKEKKDRKEADLTPHSMQVAVDFTCELLGTASADPELYETFIGKKSADAEKVKEEIASLSQEELVEKGQTIFHRGEEGGPILYDYQIKGMIKEAMGAAVETGVLKCGTTEITKYTVKRFVDNFIFVYPREIPLIMPDGGAVTQCVRPLRAETLRGPRIALASSEQVPRGTQIQFTVEWLLPGLERHVRNALNYGARKGIGQWRNSGKGRFEWREIG